MERSSGLADFRFISPTGQIIGKLSITIILKTFSKTTNCTKDTILGRRWKRLTKIENKHNELKKYHILVYVNAYTLNFFTARGPGHLDEATHGVRAKESKGMQLHSDALSFIRMSLKGNVQKKFPVNLGTRGTENLPYITILPSNIYPAITVYTSG